MQRASAKPSRIICRHTFRTVHRNVLGEHADDLGLQGQILPRSRRHARWILSLRDVLVDGWGDRQDTADRLDSIDVTVIVNERDHRLNGRPISPTLKVVLRGDIYRSGSSWTEFRHTSAFQRFLPACNLVSLRAGLGSIADDWNASLFVNDVFNDNTVVSKLGSNLFGGLDQVRAISSVPRTVGIDLTRHF